jgi:hypothetical protein
MDPSHLVASPCAPYERSHDDACDYHWVKQHDAATRHHARRRPRTHRAASRAPAATPDGAPSASSVTAPHPKLPKLPPAPKLPPLPDLPPLPAVPQVQPPPGVPPADRLLDYLLGS